VIIEDVFPTFLEITGGQMTIVKETGEPVPFPDEVL